MNKSWTKWCIASIHKHFNDHRDGVPMFIEGQDRQTAKLKKFFELRVDGPVIRCITAGEFTYFFEVNALIQILQSETTTHEMLDTIGLLTTIFDDISVYKLGAGTEDTGEFVGCLTLVTNDHRNREKLVVSNYGQINPELRLLQASVEGHYIIELNS